MDLGEIRAAFVKRSGRYDLVIAGATPPEEGADSGADFYINSGQRFLDRLHNVHKSVGRVFKSVAAGRNYILFEDCRAIKEAWCMNSESRTQLDKHDMADIRLAYAKPVSLLDNGVPLYYAPAVLRTIPESDRMIIDEFEGIIDYADVAFGMHYNYNGIIFMPPADGDYVIEVWGLFYSPELSAEDDKSFWSVVHPSVLLMAAMRELEVVYRNTEGVKDWENAINSELVPISKDIVEEDIADADQMKG